MDHLCLQQRQGNLSLTPAVSTRLLKCQLDASDEGWYVLAPPSLSGWIPGCVSLITPPGLRAATSCRSAAHSLIERGAPSVLIRLTGPLGALGTTMSEDTDTLAGTARRDVDLMEDPENCSRSSLLAAMRLSCLAIAWHLTFRAHRRCGRPTCIGVRVRQELVNYPDHASSGEPQRFFARLLVGAAPDLYDWLRERQPCRGRSSIEPTLRRACSGITPRPSSTPPRSAWSCRMTTSGAAPASARPNAPWSCAATRWSKPWSFRPVAPCRRSQRL